MDGVLSKMDSYEILTNLLPGAFFVIGLNFVFDLNVLSENLLEGILICYFAGLVINRVSSLIVRPMLKFLRIVGDEPYSDYVSAVRKDPKIDKLSRANNSFRSFFTATICLPIAYGLMVLYERWSWFSVNWNWLALVFLVILFLSAHIKQNNFVRRRVKVNDGSKTESKKTP